jgi:hypothetical protein
MKILRWQTAGNVHDDSLSVELLDGDSVVADFTRYDGRKELKINTFGNDIDLHVLEDFIRFARLKLGPFEDGSDLKSARATQRFSED